VSSLLIWFVIIITFILVFIVIKFAPHIIILLLRIHNNQREFYLNILLPNNVGWMLTVRPSKIVNVKRHIFIDFKINDSFFIFKNKFQQLVLTKLIFSHGTL
jgi:hypothetical protein